MSRESVLLGALTTELTSTSDLYERVGYGALARIGLIPYHAFRAELQRLESTGVLASETWNQRLDDVENRSRACG